MTPPGRETGESTIRALHDRLAAGWGRGSGAAVADPFWDDAMEVAFDGSWLDGRAAIARFHEEALAGPLAGTRLAEGVRSIRFLSRDVAILRAEGGPAFPAQPDAAAGRGGFRVYVAQRRRGEWRFATGQNVRARFGGAREDAVRLKERLRQLFLAT